MIQTAQPWAPGRSPSARLLTRAAVRCIEGYQRHVSPHKGFSCAYRVHHQAESCSAYVKRVLLEDGMAGAFAKTKARFAACREAHLALLAIGADAAHFADPAWLSGMGDGLVQARTWCVPTPFGCCMFSS
jgi:putative component of membrane protein insertase Oxa1/YidC/SpoIIIJ protein YidD